MNLIILGPPGSGKGTQSEFLVRIHQFYQLSTGNLLRSEVQAQTSLGKSVKHYLDGGNYVPDQLVNDIVAHKLTTIKTANIVYDGYPRTIDQVHFLQNCLAKKQQQIDLVLYLQIDQEVLIKRIKERLVCPTCGKTYNQTLLPPKITGVCDLDSTTLVRRSDDVNQAKIINRFQVYQNETARLIEYFAQTGLLTTIDANQPLEAIQAAISAVITKGKNHDHH